MRGRKKRCPWCHKVFAPHPRLGRRQVSCGGERCRRQQKRLADKRYKQNNQDIYLANRQEWLNRNPGYWKQYRTDHSQYAARNRVQTKLRKSLSNSSKSGLQKRIDILQPLESQMEFWNLPRFAKAPRSIVPILYAYSCHQQMGQYQTPT